MARPGRARSATPAARRAPAGAGRDRKRGEDDNRRGQLIDAAARLFRDKGYHGTSVREIAHATGMQSGSWVYHFRTKQDLLAAVMEQGLAEALARVDEIVALGLPSRTTFEALVRAHLETLLGPGRDFIPVLLYEWPSLEPAARRRVLAPALRYEAAWDEVIGELQAAGEWAGPTRVDRLLLFGALNWIARWYRADGALGLDALAGECVRFFLRTPAPRAAPRRVTSPPGARRRTVP
jgi:AcrR family transcriptional regulator